MSQEIKNLSDLLQDNEIKTRVEEIEELNWTDGYGEPLDAENLNLITDSIADNSKIIRSTINELKELRSDVNTIETKVFKATITEDTDVNNINLEASPNSGDILIVTATHKNDQLTGYIWTENGWCALNGNYDANNIYFTEDMTVTKEIGYITLSNGRGTIPSKGKNLTGVFEAMFVDEQDPTKTDPSVSVTLTGAGSYEVGTIVEGIKYSASFEDGEYTYGPEPTGASVTSWEVTDTEGNDYTTNSGDLANITVTDNTNFTVTAKATYTAGNTPKTNLGNDCKDSSKQIEGGSKSETSNAITGYRYAFAGGTNSSTLNSTIIRSATAKKKSKASMDTQGEALEFFAYKGETKVFFAYPSTWEGTPYFEMFGLAWAENTDIVDKGTVKVADRRGAKEDGTLNGAFDYKLYTWELDTPLQAESTKFRVWFK